MINCYQVPTEFIIPTTVIECDGKYYSFGATIRSCKSIWDEVKDKLDTLNECEFTEEDKASLAEFLVEVIGEGE